MGTFYTHCAVQNATDRSRQARVGKILVDTGSEHTWIPASTLDRLGVVREKKDVTFVMANGSHISRSVGFAIIRIDDAFTIDEVVFADKGDLLLLGARTLEGLNLTVDARRKKLVAAGPFPVASSSHRGAPVTSASARLHQYASASALAPDDAALQPDDERQRPDDGFFSVPDDAWFWPYSSRNAEGIGRRAALMAGKRPPIKPITSE